MSTYDNQTGRLAPQSMLHQRYLIVGQAGRGGMSAVYQAVDTLSRNRHVAIKEMSQGHLSSSELAEATARFQQEAALLRSLQHPNLPRIYDGFSEYGRSYLVMEFIDGKTLLQMLKDSGGRPLPILQVLDYAIQLCDVLTYLHSQNPPVIFRDLKPTNVMVKENGHVVLIDFGIARFFKEGQAQDTVFLGSPGYAPPEQHGASQTNPRSDLYSLGATLHCCLTGRDPFHATDRFAFPPVSQLNPSVPFELDQLILRLVSMDSTNQVSTNPPTVPVSTPPAYGQLPPITRAPQARVISSLAAVWTTPFIILFGVMLAFTLGGSIWAFTSIQYSDHIVEFSLSILLFLVAIGAAIIVRGSIPRIILIFAGIAILISGFAFLVQASPALQTTLASSSPFAGNTSSNLSNLLDFLNKLLTIGLAAAAIILLLWLIRPFSWINRLILLVLFGTAAVCTFIQFSYPDELVLQLQLSNLGDLTQAINNEAVPKHILLLTALIALLLGILIGAQIERVRRR